MPTTIAVHKNVDTIRRGYEAFNKGDMKTLTELFHEKASWHVPGKGALAGDYRGREAVLALFGKIGQECRGTFKAELRHALVDEDGRVVGMEHLSAQRNGKRLSADACLVFEFKDGRVISGTEYIHDLYGSDQFWS